MDELDDQRLKRIKSGEWSVFYGTGGEPVFRVVSYRSEPDLRRCTNFLTLQEVAEILNCGD